MQYYRLAVVTAAGGVAYPWVRLGSHRKAPNVAWSKIITSGSGQVNARLEFTLDDPDVNPSAHTFAISSFAQGPTYVTAGTVNAVAARFFVAAASAGGSQGFTSILLTMLQI